MRVLVLKAPGTNCDLETASAFARLGCRPEVIPFADLRSNPRALRNYDIFVIPGGFSYGDDIAAGKVLALQIRKVLLDEILEFHRAGKLILGVCNGFQALLKAGLLPEPSEDPAALNRGPRVTLSFNSSGRFEDRWVSLSFNACSSPIGVALRDCGLWRMECPVAHAEGRVTFASEEDLADFDNGQRLIIRYTHPHDPSFDPATTPLPYPYNPNGSAANIAGFSDSTGRIVGLMPHPERAAADHLHPHWTRAKQPHDRFHSGLTFLRALVASIEAARV